MASFNICLRSLVTMCAENFGLLPEGCSNGGKTPPVIFMMSKRESILLAHRATSPVPGPRGALLNLFSCQITLLWPRRRRVI